MQYSPLLLEISGSSHLKWRRRIRDGFENLKFMLGAHRGPAYAFSVTCAQQYLRALVTEGADHLPCTLPLQSFTSCLTWGRGCGSHIGKSSSVSGCCQEDFIFSPGLEGLNISTPSTFTICYFLHLIMYMQNKPSLVCATQYQRELWCDQRWL